MSIPYYLLKPILFVAALTLTAFFSVTASATTLYSTTFPSPPYLQNQIWAGIDGWLGINTSNAMDDAILDVGGGNLGALLGLDNGNDENVISVYREVNYDPVTQGEPIVTLSLRLGFQQSTNGNHDVFSIAFFNQSVEILGEFVVEPETGSVLYFDGTQNVDTGLDITGTGFVNLVILIDFEQNKWSATIDGTPYFTDVNFADPLRMIDLNLGSIDFRWSPTDPMNSGDNYMVLDDLVLSANSRLAPVDAAPTLTTKRKIKTSKGKVTLRGTAADDVAVGQVQYKTKKGGYRSARGTTSWNFKAKLKPGNNKFLVRSVDSVGQVSPPTVVKVKRR